MGKMKADSTKTAVDVPFDTVYVAPDVFSGKTGLPLQYVRALCRARKITCIRMGATRYLIHGAQALADLTAMALADTVVYADARSENGRHRNTNASARQRKHRSVPSSAGTDISALQREAAEVAGQ